MKKTIKTSYFCGNKVSDYGVENGYVDYATLAKSFDAVLNNGIYQKAWNLGEWEQVNGCIDNSDELYDLNEELETLNEELEQLKYEGDDENQERIDELYNKLSELEEKIQELEEEQNCPPEIFQWYIISDSGSDILKNWTNEIVFYHEELDMYLWGVTHYGTSWDYVLTDIKIDK